MFLTVRWYLQKAGAPVAGLAPSTGVSDFTRNYAEVFLGPISQLAPGALPRAKMWHPIYDACVGTFLIALFGIFVGACARLWTMIAVSSFIAIASFMATWVAAQVRPAKVEFEGIRTFRNLAIALAKSIDQKSPSS